MTGDGVDLGEALKDSIPHPDGHAGPSGVVGALRVTDRALLVAHRYALKDSGDEAETAWLDGVLNNQPEWNPEAFSRAFQQTQILGFVDAHGPTALGKLQIAALYSRFKR